MQNTLEGYLFVGTNLSVLPKFGPEEINIATIADRQARMEETVNTLSSNIIALKPDSAEMEHRLNVFESVISSQLEKLTALSDQLAATAAMVKDFGSAVILKETSALQTDQQMLLYLALRKVHICVSHSHMFTYVWRQAVANAFRHILGHDVDIDDMLRVGRHSAGKIRPIIVRLHSAWDRRLLLSSTFKLKSFDDMLYLTNHF